MVERPNPRPLLVTFHCGFFFFIFALFTVAIGRRDVEESFSQISPNYIRNMMILLGINFVGYLGLWNLRRFGLLILLAAGIPLVVYGHQLAAAGNPVNYIPHYLPVVAGISCLPLWPMLKVP